MFLRNYDNIIVLNHFDETASGTRWYSAQQYIGSSTVFGDGNVNVRHTDGSISSCTMAGNYSDMQYFANMYKSNICIGTGNTPVTYEDYTLSGTVLDNSKLAYVSSKIDYDATNRKVSKTVTYTYTNETEEAITISEWGLLYKHRTGTTFVTKDNTLLFREVLETPIVIEAGTTATIKFKVDVPISNHP